MGLHKIKKLLHNKSNAFQSEETTNIWKKIFTIYTSDKRLITRIYRELKNWFKFNEPIEKWATELNRTFLKEEIQMNNKHMKKCSRSSHKGYANQMLSFHHTPVRINIIKNTNTNRCWPGCGKKGTHLNCWWECKLVQPLWKKIWRLLKNLNIDLPYDHMIQQSHCWEYTQMNATQVTPKLPAHPCLLKCYSQ
jgi:hypothetical protein